ALADFVKAAGLGVLSVFRHQDVFPNDDPAYIGHLGLTRAPYLREAWREVDLIVAAGARLDDITMAGFTLRRPDQALIQFHPDPDAVAPSRAEVGMACDAGPGLRALTAAVAPPPAERLAWRERVHGRYLAFRDPATRKAGAVNLAAVVAAVDRLTPADAV